MADPEELQFLQDSADEWNLSGVDLTGVPGLNLDNAWGAGSK